MKRAYIILAVIILLGALLVAYGKYQAGNVPTTTVQETPANTDNVPPGYDPKIEAQWVNDYDFGADSHKRIASASDHAYYCKIHDRYEGPTVCYLFLEKGGVYSPTGLEAQDVATTLLVSSDGKNIVVIEPQKATLIRVADDQRRVLYSVGDTESLGYYGNSDFRARARWASNNVIEIKIFSENADTDDSSPVRTQSITI